MGDGLFGASDSLFGIPAIGAPKVGFHQLVVLGNGFDLECGLPTRFSHFFEPRLEALLTQNWKSTGRLEGLGYEATPTVWDFLLRSSMYAPWYSVEDAVNDIVLSAGDGTSEARGIAAKLIARIYRLSAAGESDPHLPDKNSSITSDEEDLHENETLVV